MSWDPWQVKNEAEALSYKYFDKLVRPLPKKKDGSFDSSTFADNDVDAFRHAFVSGIFVHEYGSTVSYILGTANEVFTFLYNSPNTAKSRNMDLWNNAVGRSYGRKTRKPETLAKALIKAMRAGELILDLKDSRQHREQTNNKLEPSKPVVVLKRSETGRNLIFFDLISHETMTRAQFVNKIKKGEYPGYRVAIYYSIPTPVSKRDGKLSTNLG